MNFPEDFEDETIPVECFYEYNFYEERKKLYPINLHGGIDPSVDESLSAQIKHEMEMEPKYNGRNCT